jgi:sugar lactone lactonase YvrE
MDRNSCTVVVVTDEGEVTGEFGHIYDPQGDVTESFVMADYLCVDNSGSVLVSDAGNHCIKVFDDQGQMTSRISGRGHEDDRLEWPKGICVDDKGIIYIADHGNSRVSVFLRDGRFVCHVIARCKLPVGLAFHPPNTLALTQYSLDGRSQISVFSLEMIMTGVEE